MSAGTYIFSSLCSTTGMPLPLFHTEMVLDSLGDKEEHGNEMQLYFSLKVYLYFRLTSDHDNN